MKDEAGAPGSFAGLSLSRPRVMGIVNVTPDSFSDGGETLAYDDAIRRGRRMLADGADILDVGGESTRPGAKPVDAATEIARVVPVIQVLAKDGALVSIDTRHAPVMAAAIAAGARIVNDVTALTDDSDSLKLVAAGDVSVVLMHMLGEPGTMQDDPRYDDAARDVFHYLKGRVAACEKAGIARHRIAVDPGIGFGKTVDHNLRILNRLDLYRGLGCPLLIGLSRKSFIARLSRGEPPKERLAGSIAAALAALQHGVRLLFRVHDVAETVQAFKVWQAVEAGRTPPAEKI
ncbi:MAG TPA: dihydropteroate synthase [Kiloniellales bacterium]